MNKILSDLAKEKSDELEDVVNKIAEVFPYSREEIISTINWSEQLHSDIEESKLKQEWTPEKASKSLKSILEQIRVQGI